MRNLAEKPDIFKLMEVISDRNAAALSSLIIEYGKYSREEYRDSALNTFTEIRNYLARQDDLIEHADDNPELQRSVDVYKRKRDSILEHILEMEEMTAEGELYLSKLKKLRGLLRVLAELENTKLHKRLKRYVKPEDLQETREQMLEETTGKE